VEIISIIPARGGSKSIPLKNLHLLCGKPLLDYSVQSSLKSKFIKRTIVSSDHNQILKRAKKIGAEIIKRPKRLAGDFSTTESTIKHCLDYLKKRENYFPDVIVLLQNTSPLRTSKHIDDAINQFLKNNVDSILSGYASHHFLWKSKNKEFIPINYNPKKRPMRQKFAEQFIENGAIYITKYSAFQKTKCRISGKIGMYEMAEELSIDIDTKSDLIKASHIIKRKK